MHTKGSDPTFVDRDHFHIQVYLSIDDLYTALLQHSPPNLTRPPLTAEIHLLKVS